MSCSRSTSCRCCSRSAAPGTSRGSPTQVTDKLIRRHPHVFGDVEADTSVEVRRNWDQIKRTEPGREQGVFGEIPENLPGPLYARKVQRRAASSGFDFPGVEGPLQSVRDELDELESARAREEQFHELGDVLFAAVNVARKLTVDPELALRAAADRFRAASARARGSPHRKAIAGTISLLDEQLAYYARARLNEGAQHEPDRARPRPPDPRQPGEPDRRGRAERPVGRVGTRGGALGRVRPASSRRPSCATAGRTGWARA